MGRSSFYSKACRVIPAGVNSPVRAFRAVGGDPLFVKSGRGAKIRAEDGRTYLDFCMSWGALLFGHAPAGLLAAVRKGMAGGTSFGIATRREVDLAEKISRIFPSMEKLRLVSSGTEAVMSAVRLARGFTGRTKILKIDGGYHGHVDSLLVKAGSGGATFGLPDSAGVPADLARHTLSVPFNDFDALEKIFRREGRHLAAFILEPVPANMGVIPPEPGYLEKVRHLTRRAGALLILDEVITGFRLAAGGAQEFYGIEPDLTCLGKILGGGLPIAAFGGRAEIMNQLAPLGPVYQAGTLAGNPLAVSAALWMLSQLRAGGGVPDAVNRRAENFYQELRRGIRRHNLPVQLNTAGSMFTLFFTSAPVTDYRSAKTSDTRRFGRFFHRLLKSGLYFSPSQFEADFLSAAHSGAQLSRAAARILEAAARV